MVDDYISGELKRLTGDSEPSSTLECLARVEGWDLVIGALEIAYEHGKSDAEKDGYLNHIDTASEPSQ